MALAGLLPCSVAHPIHNLADGADLRVNRSLHRLLGHLTAISGLFGLVSEDGQTELSAEVCVAVVAYRDGDHVTGLTDIPARRHTVGIGIFVLFQLRLHCDGHLPWPSHLLHWKQLRFLATGRYPVKHTVEQKSCDEPFLWNAVWPLSRI